jgi:hypothetical protein
MNSAMVKPMPARLPAPARARHEVPSGSLAYHLPLLVVLRFPLHFGVPLAASLSLGWCLWALGARPLLRWGPLAGAIA